MPGELTMLGKTLLNLDRVGMALWPNSARTTPSAAMWRISCIAKPCRASRLPICLGTAMEAKELMERLPRG